jgi:osmotically-inducible protein OsmY
MAITQRNKDLRTRVLDELDWEPSIDSAEIGVAVKDGVVTLTGHVPTYAQKRTAEQTAIRLSGVRGVANDLEVQLPPEHERSDADLARAAVEALDRNVQIPADAVKVKVDGAWVTLDGVVHWDYQRRRAERAVRYLVGVRGVNNLLRVEEQASPGDLHGRIRRALERRVDEEARRIDVRVEGDTVTLIGTVPSWTDRDDIETAVWAAPGIRQVKNELKVSRRAYA